MNLTTSAAPVESLLRAWGRLALNCLPSPGAADAGDVQNFEVKKCRTAAGLVVRGAVCLIWVECSCPFYKFHMKATVEEACCCCDQFSTEICHHLLAPTAGQPLQSLQKRTAPGQAVPMSWHVQSSNSIVSIGAVCTEQNKACWRKCRSSHVIQAGTALQFWTFRSKGWDFKVPPAPNRSLPSTWSL